MFGKTAVNFAACSLTRLLLLFILAGGSLPALADTKPTPRDVAVAIEQTARENRVPSVFRLAPIDCLHTIDRTC